jgi:hypothetical protein
MPRHAHGTLDIPSLSDSDQGIRLRLSRLRDWSAPEANQSENGISRDGSIPNAASNISQRKFCRDFL